MKIALPTNDGATISQHFGRSAGFLVFEIEDGKIKGREMRANAPHHAHAPGACSHEAGETGSHNHAGIVAALDGCNVIICAGMGWRAAEALKAAGISEIATTAPGPAEDAVTAYLAGALPVADQGFCRCSH